MSIDKADFTFHGIGQGLFYSGTIHNESDQFTFIYDCGTLYKKDRMILKSKIDKLFCCLRSGEHSTVDILFLSHLDKDHISGVPYLLSKYKVRNVFIPYLTPAELFLLAVENSIATDIEDSKLYDLYRNPVRYFSNYGCTVFVIHPEDDDLFRSIEDRQAGYENDVFFISEGQVKNQHGAIHCTGNISLNSYHFDWKFKVYHDQTKKEQEKIVREIEVVLPFAQSDWQNKAATFFQDESLKQQVHSIYNKLKYGINQSSLILLHYPIENFSVYSECYRYYPWCHYECGMGFQAATLLTGDINLNKLNGKGKRFLEFINKTEKSIGIMQLPHHGAGNNLSINLIKTFFDRYMRAVCSYGRGNHFNHPDAYLLDKLMVTLPCSIKHVVSDQDYYYTITN